MATFANSSNWPRIRRRIVKLSLDSIITLVAHLAAIAAQYPTGIAADAVPSLITWCLGSAFSTVAILFLGNEYFRIWRYTSLVEALRIAVTQIGNLICWTIVLNLALKSVPGSLPVINCAFGLIALLGLRVIRRYAEYPLRGGQNWINRIVPYPNQIPQGSPKALLIGAGREADSLIQDLMASRDGNVEIVGILDDDVTLIGERLRNIPVLGQTSKLAGIIRSTGATRVIIAAPTLSGLAMRQLIGVAHSCGASVKALPRIGRLGGVGTNNSHTVTIKDLLDSVEVKRTLLTAVDTSLTPKPILVTGGAGYIGSHLVRLLLERGHRVRVLDNFIFGDHGLLKYKNHPNLEVRHGDIADLRNVVGAVKDVESVVSLAAIVGDPACGLNAEETLTLNYEATKVLVEACNFYGVNRLLFTSSCSVYGASQDELLTETSPLNPVSLYARTRIMSEEVLRERSGDVNTTIVRLATVYGLSSRMRFDLVLNTMTARAFVNRTVRILGGDQWRPFVHCADVASALIAILGAPEERVSGETFNLGSTDMNYTLSEVGSLVAKRVGDDVQVINEEFVDDRRNYRVSFEKLKAITGWNRQQSLESGIDEIVEALSRDENLRAYDRSVYSNLQYLKEHLTATGRIA